MDESVQKLIGQLRDFRARRDAKRRLVSMGSAAVEPLLAALRDPSEGVRWAVVSILGEIGDKQAIEPLVDALGDSSIVGAVANTLKAITGEDFGENADRWTRWLRGEPVGATQPSAAAREPLTDAELVRQGLKGVADEIQESGDLYIVKVRLKDGRQQMVRINPAFKDSDDNAVVLIETVCGPASAKHHDWALRQNLKLPFGAIAVRDIGNQPHYVLVNTLLRATADPPEIYSSAQTIAQWGDAIEKALLKEDIH